MTSKEIATLTNEELKKNLLSEKKALFELRMKGAVDTNKDTSLYSKYKKSIARIKTTINDKNKLK